MFRNYLYLCIMIIKYNYHLIYDYYNIIIMIIYFDYIFIITIIFL